MEFGENSSFEYKLEKVGEKPAIMRLDIERDAASRDYIVYLNSIQVDSSKNYRRAKTYYNNLRRALKNHE